MGFWRFYMEVSRRAFSGKFYFAEKRAGGFAMLLSLAWIFVSSRYPDWEPIMTWLPIAVFIGLFFLVIVIGYVVAPFSIYQDEKKSREAAEAAKAALSKSNSHLTEDISKLRHPLFVATISSSLMGNLENGGSHIGFLIVLENLGAEAAVIETSWRLFARMPTGKMHEGLPRDRHDATVYPVGSSDVVMVYRREETLAHKSMSPIPRMAYVLGFLDFDLPYISYDDLCNLDIEFFVTGIAVGGDTFMSKVTSTITLRERKGRVFYPSLTYPTPIKKDEFELGQQPQGTAKKTRR